MSSNVTFNGSTYSIPADGDSGWGTNLSSYLIAIASGALQKTGGTFALTSEVDFGATFGAKLAYLKSQAANTSSSGIIRLGNAESIKWRNAANNADIDLTLNASNALQFNGSSLLAAGAGSIVNADINAAAAIDYSKLNLASSIVNADVSNSAAIAYSKLNLSTSIVNADISNSAAIAYSKLNLATSIVNADINAAAAIAYSKLNLATSIVNADISTSAAIALSKLAALTTSRALQSNSSTGAIEVSSVTNTELGYVSGVTSAIQTQINAKISNTLTTTTGDIIYASGANTPARLGIGSAGQVLSVSGGIPAWTAAAAAPLTSYEMSNLGLAVSVASSAMTIALKQSDGSTDASTGAAAVKIGFRSSTLTSGGFNQRSVTGALSMVVSSGSTLGMANSVAANLWVYAIDNAGTVELAISQSLFQENGVISTTAEGGAGAADSNAVMYSTTARSNVPFRLIGKLVSTQTTAGTWASVPSTISAGDYGSLTAFDTVSARYTNSSTSISGTTTVVWTNKDFDSHTAMSSGVFTAPMAGKYQVNAQLFVTATYTAANALDLIIQKNSSDYSRSRLIAPTVSGGLQIWVSDIVSCAAGDPIRIQVSTAGGTPSIVSSTIANYVSIARIGN